MIYLMGILLIVKNSMVYILHSYIELRVYVISLGELYVEGDFDRDNKKMSE